MESLNTLSALNEINHLTHSITICLLIRKSNVIVHQIP